MKHRENRYADLREMRVEGGKDGLPLKILGYAAVFESLSVPLGSPATEEGEEGGVFFEVITQGAFSESLALSDVRCLWNHEDRLVLGRTRAGNLKLWEDERGLGFELTLPDVSYARDVAELVRSELAQGCSFGFNVAEEDQAVEDRGDGIPLRRLNRVELVEISIGVTWPAYPDTTSEVRSAITHWKTSRSAFPPAVAQAPTTTTPRLRKALRELAILE